MANKKALTLDQLKTSLDAVKTWSSNEINNATKDKADKDIVLLKNNTTEFTPTNDYEPATKKYVDDNINTAGGDFIPLAGGEFELQNCFTFNNIPVVYDDDGKLLKVRTKEFTDPYNYTWKYFYDFPSNGAFALSRYQPNNNNSVDNGSQGTLIYPFCIFMGDDKLAGDHRKLYLRADSLQMRRYNNGWKDFWIKTEKDRTQIYNDQKLIDFNDSRIENVGSPIEDSDAATKKYADTESKIAKHFIFDSDDNIIGVKIKDQVNNYNYIMCMRNGTLATTCAAKSIAVTTSPTKMTYTAGDNIDTTGMIVTATCEDDTTREITNYTCTNTVTTDNPTFTITYNEGGTILTTTLIVTVNTAS